MTRRRPLARWAQVRLELIERKRRGELVTDEDDEAAARLHRAMHRERLGRIALRHIHERRG